jgi:hypothetical protein
VIDRREAMDMRGLLRTLKGAKPSPARRAFASP